VRDAATVVVVDNTPRDSSEALFARLRVVDPRVRTVKAQRNLGYFGGACHGWEEWQKEPGILPEWVVVSNVDVGFVDQAFFVRLLQAPYPGDIGVVAPSIRSEARHGDWNPKIGTRPSRRRMHAYKLLYRSRWLFNFYEMLARVKYALTGSRRSRAGSEEPGTTPRFIYAAHGACMLFAREYFVRGGTLRYPSFLFGEEIFVAETARELGLRTVYDPQLAMTSEDHVSTGWLRSKRMVEYMRESAVFLADRYFP
jgi:GT2 family glycosyltransferase